MIKSFIKDEQAATAIEYVLIASAICIAIAATVYIFGDQILVLFNKVGDELARV